MSLQPKASQTDSGSPETQVVTEPAAILASLPKRKTVKASHVYGMLLALLCVVLGVFTLGYLRLVHYKPRLLSHVPDSAVFALHINLQQVVYFEPVRRYLFPWFQTSGFRGAAAWERVQRESEVNLTMDVREVLLATNQSGDWILGVAGRFDTARLYKALAEEWTESGVCKPVGTDSLQCAQGALLKTTDEVLLLGTGLRAVQEAASSGERAFGLGLRESSAFTWGLALDGATAQDWGPAARRLRDAGVTRLSGTLEPENPLRADLWLNGKDGKLVDSALPLVRAAVADLPPAAREISVESLRDAADGTPGQSLAARFPRTLLMESFERFVAWFSLRAPANP